MPDPLPPTVAIEPAGYLVEFVTGALAWGAKPHPADDKTGPHRHVEPLYRRDDIAPLRVPLVDQHNNVMGYENRKARELLIERVWTDKDGVVWSRPTAFAYAAVCEARHQWEMTAGDARALLATLVDGILGEIDLIHCGSDFNSAVENARAFLDKTDRSRNVDAKEPTE